MIDKFEGEYAFLSNFAHSSISDGNIIFPTVEHYFQAAKTLNMTDYEAIAAAGSPGQAKRLGRNVELREDWEEIKEQVMLDALRKKFEKPAFRAMLLSTGDEELIEGTTWHDNTWGNCTCERCKNIEGQNKLGKLLMQVREEIKSSM